MKPSIRAITLGVSDFDRAVRFYRGGLGLPLQGILGIAPLQRLISIP